MQSVIPKLAKLFPQSLTSEICKLLGPEATEKFIAVFAGTTLKIPSTKDFLEAKRNLAIYDSIKLSKTKEEATKIRAILAKQYHMSVKEVRYVNRKIKKLVREAEKFTIADAKTGQHQPSRMKVKRKKKRRM